MQAYTGKIIVLEGLAEPVGRKKEGRLIQPSVPRGNYPEITALVFEGKCSMKWGKPLSCPL